MSAEPLLRVDELVKHFPVSAGVFGRTVAQVRAVDGVSFELAPGRTLGLVGESGCGKTTVGQSIVRLLEPTAGRIVFGGRDITHTPLNELRDLRRDLQFIFQDPFGSLNPRMTVADIIGEAVEVHGMASGDGVERHVLEVMGRVGLPGSWINRYPHEFSGGQRQRISIARAIALEPKLVVCDEAVSALDVSIQAQVINLLIQLRREMGLGYVFISHDLSVVKHISDDVAVMYLGQIVESATTHELYSRPAHPYARSLLSAIPIPDPSRRSDRMVLEGDVPTPLNPPPGCRFHTRCPAVTERCRSEEPPALPVFSDGGQSHRVKCWHSEALAEEPDWFRIVTERTDEAVRALRRAQVAPASRFALAAERERVARPSEPIAASRRPKVPRARWPHIDKPQAALGSLAVAALFVVSDWPWVAALFSGAALAVWFRTFESARQRRLGAAAGLTVFVLGYALSQAVEARQRVLSADAQLSALTHELEAVAEITGRYPAKLKDLGWRLAAIADRDGLDDPWGGVWLYEVPGTDGRPYDLGSAGPDGMRGSDDDVGRVPRAAPTFEDVAP